MTAAFPPSCNDWLAAAPGLLAERDAALWAFADWLAGGRRSYGAAAAIKPVAEHLRVTAHKLRALAKVADAFPPDRREPRLAFDVHAHLAGMSEEARAIALSRAAEEGWGEREAKAAAVEHRQAAAMFDDEDEETRQAVEVIRAWNRAMPDARAYFMDLAMGVGTGAIDEDAPPAEAGKVAIAGKARAC